METTIKIDANQQALELKVSFERRAQLLALIYNEQLAIAHYEPDVIERLFSSNIYTVCIAYRHFSYHIEPSRHQVFQYKETSKDIGNALNIGMTEVVRQLREFQIGKEQDKEALDTAKYGISTFIEASKFLNMIYQQQIALADYVPKIKIGEMQKTGIQYFSVEYKHKYFLTRREKDKHFRCESTPANEATGLMDCMQEVIAQIKEFHLRG